VAALVPSAGTITLQIELRSEADAVSTPHPVRVRIAARCFAPAIPHYVSGIKPGWYAIEDDGDLLFRAFFQSLGMRH
jgi:hypothetical protein